MSHQCFWQSESWQDKSNLLQERWLRKEKSNENDTNTKRKMKTVLKLRKWPQIEENKSWKRKEKKRRRRRRSGSYWLGESAVNIFKPARKLEKIAGEWRSRGKLCRTASTVWQLQLCVTRRKHSTHSHILCFHSLEFSIVFHRIVFREGKWCRQDKQDLDFSDSMSGCVS